MARREIGLSRLIIKRALVSSFLSVALMWFAAAGLREERFVVDQRQPRPLRLRGVDPTHGLVACWGKNLRVALHVD